MKISEDEKLVQLASSFSSATSSSNSTSNAELINDVQLCEKASYGGTTYRRWRLKSDPFVIEAKRRGLTCGVEESKQNLAKYQSKHLNDTSVCSMATFVIKSSGEKAWKSSSFFAIEAKRRGLSCGVRETNPTQAASSTVSSQNTFPSPNFQFPLNFTGS